jgi:hypothetical protein
VIVRVEFEEKTNHEMNTSNDTSPRTPILNRLSVRNVQKATPKRKSSTCNTPRDENIPLRELNPNSMTPRLNAQQKLISTPLAWKTPGKVESVVTPSPVRRTSLRTFPKFDATINDFREHYNNKEFADVIVVLRCHGESDVEIFCHALVLSQSAVFASLIKKEKTRTISHPLALKFNLDSCQLVPFRLVLQHLYGNKLSTPSIPELLLVLELAVEFEIETLEHECTKLLQVTLPHDIELFLQSDFFTSLRVEQVVEILGNDDLPIEDEQVVYEVACKYLREHPEVDASILKRVIKFPLLASSTRLADSPFAFTDKQTKELYGDLEDGDFSFSPKQYSKRHARRKLHNSESYIRSLAFSTRRTESPNAHNKTPPLLVRVLGTTGVERVLDLNLEEESNQLREFLIFQFATLVLMFVFAIMLSRYDML